MKRSAKPTTIADDEYVFAAFFQQIACNKLIVCVIKTIGFSQDMRVEYLQPLEQPEEIQNLFEVSAAVHNQLTTALNKTLTKKRSKKTKKKK